MLTLFFLRVLQRKSAHSVDQFECHDVSSAGRDPLKWWTARSTANWTKYGTRSKSPPPRFGSSQRFDQRSASAFPFWSWESAKVSVLSNCQSRWQSTKVVFLFFFFNDRLNNIRHSPSEPSLSMRSHSTSRSSSLTRNRPDLTVPTPKTRVTSLYSPFMSSQSPVGLHQDFVPVTSDKPTGLDLEDFLPVITYWWRIFLSPRYSCVSFLSSIFYLAQIQFRVDGWW